ncbi:MarR family winged helix-turn-helix transcriptional regulator [Pararhizobium antarcticum]|uniref:MarR family transcriptional regulator n=1 Tax=Pararhizobium antarcticum TaxID=1798805 RepID=A0A657LY96_9HYPH|nr:MarR family transcriptional regulator [Pararhizobium antarcticum]OJF96605.1 MarR family transcriptional regulator [Rhizobium sp. 58]OJG01389.1 MarR family transcriptional regulator [Pararhizobium antarcticum]
MGKKSKAEKKNKGKKKHDLSIGPQDIASVLVQAARSMRTVVSRNLLDSGLYAGQDGVMLLLAETDGLTAGNLAIKLGVKAPTMTRTIGRMEAQGFVERRTDDGDGRLTKVYLTELGRNSLQTIEAAGKTSETMATQGMSDKEIKTLMKLLRVVDANLQGSTPGE